MSVSRPTVREILRGAGIATVRKRGVKRHFFCWLMPICRLKKLLGKTRNQVYGRSLAS
jgi:hypothetical protein